MINFKLNKFLKVNKNILIHLKKKFKLKIKRH